MSVTVTVVRGNLITPLFSIYSIRRKPFSQSKTTHPICSGNWPTFHRIDCETLPCSRINWLFNEFGYDWKIFLFLWGEQFLREGCWVIHSICWPVWRPQIQTNKENKIQRTSTSTLLYLIWSRYTLITPSSFIFFLVIFEVEFLL